MQINEYQNEAVRTRQRLASAPDQPLVVSLLGLAGEAGELISEYKKFLRDGESYLPLQERAREELGDVLWYVASVADEFGLTLDDVATNNLRKIKDRWTSDIGPRLSGFDTHLPDAERLPDRLTVLFVDIERDGAHRTQMVVEGDGLGDPLTNNSYEDDGYRFHDVFHWTCAAALGWSPVIRKLLQRKRKGDRKTDEVEDGARAAAIEEGIAALIFSYAADRNYLHGACRVDSNLLRTIKGMTRHLEVSVRSPGEWERAILATFKVWRELHHSHGGSVVIDLTTGTIEVLAKDVAVLV